MKTIYLFFVCVGNLALKKKYVLSDKHKTGISQEEKV